MKDTNERAKAILNAYVSHVKDTWRDKRAKPLVTTNVYDNFAKGVRTIMPDVDETTIDEMFKASGFDTGKYRKTSRRTGGMRRAAMIMRRNLSLICSTMPRLIPLSRLPTLRTMRGLRFASTLADAM